MDKQKVQHYKFVRYTIQNYVRIQESTGEAYYATKSGVDRQRIHLDYPQNLIFELYLYIRNAYVFQFES